MSIKKTILTVAAVGGLTAATAVPAMALENTFHGVYRMKFYVSNFDNAGAGYYAPTTARGTSDSAVNYFEQRTRIFYTAKANDDLKLVAAWEMDLNFGDKSQGALTAPATTAFRNSGGALDTDAVNLETKWLHLDFNIPGVPTNVKVGTQAIKDSFKGILFDCDAAGIFTSTKIGDNAKVNLGYFRGYEGNNGDTNGGGAAGALSKMGVNNLDLAILEGKFNISKDLAVGAAYYGYFDYRDATATILDHTFGVNADAKMGPLGLSGFIAGQLGTTRGGAVNPTGGGKSVDMSGIAANVSARLKAGPGTAKLTGLFTSGDKGTNATKNGSWLSLQQSASGAINQSSGSLSLNEFNESGMMLLNRNYTNVTNSTDRNIVYSTNNRNQGVVLVAAGYDAQLTPKAYANANVGMAWVAEARRANLNDKNAADNLINGSGRSMFLGTEVNLETGYKLYDNLTASVQGAYVILGDYYKGMNPTRPGKDPDNPYTTRLVLSYIF